MAKKMNAKTVYMHCGSNHVYGQVEYPDFIVVCAKPEFERRLAEIRKDQFAEEVEADYCRQ